MPPRELRAGIYTRISLDRSGKRAGVQRQQTDCEALCGRRGWKVVDYFEDNDRSAYSGRERPEYERMLTAVGAGKIDVVVAWHSDRLWRSVLEQQVFLALGQDSGLQLVATPNQDYDPADADDSFTSTLQAAMAQKESADKARRMKRKQLEKAEKGEFHGGQRAYGHDRTRTKVVEREARIIRDVVKRVLAGEPIQAITMELRRRGIQTTQGNLWRQDTLRDLVQQPRLAGLRDHKGVVTGPATWPAIITVKQHERLTALFASRRLDVRREYIVRKYLLGGGLLQCSRCDHALKASAQDGIPRYICPSPALGGCSGTTIVLDRTDEVVRDMVLDRIDSPAFARALRRAEKAAANADSETAALLEQMTTDRARLTELGNMLADGQLDRAEYERLRGRVAARIDDSDARLRAVDAVVPASGLADQADVLRRAWDRMELDEKRTVISAVADHFVVLPAERPVNVFRPSRIEPVWRF